MQVLWLYYIIDMFWSVLHHWLILLHSRARPWTILSKIVANIYCYIQLEWQHKLYKQWCLFTLATKCLVSPCMICPTTQQALHIFLKTCDQPIATETFIPNKLSHVWWSNQLTLHVHTCQQVYHKMSPLRSLYKNGVHVCCCPAAKN